MFLGALGLTGANEQVRDVDVFEVRRYLVRNALQKRVPHQSSGQSDRRKLPLAHMCHDDFEIVWQRLVVFRPVIQIS